MVMYIVEASRVNNIMLPHAVTLSIEGNEQAHTSALVCVCDTKKPNSLGLKEFHSV